MSKPVFRFRIIFTILIHALAWIGYFIINEFEPVVEGYSHLVFLISVLSYFLLACIFYCIYFYLNPKYLSKNKWWEYLAAVVILFFIYNFGRELQLKLLHIEYPNYTEIAAINLIPITFTGIMLRSFTYYIFHIPIFTCFFIWKNSKNTNQLLLKKQQEVADLKAANIQSELSFLQSQINPHFLFNTLNSFYSKTVQLSSEVAEGIEILSNIMRYAIAPYGPNNERKDYVMLDDEIIHIKNVIKIYNMRFSKMYLDFHVQGLTKDFTIIPFVLITLVENVFKHGDLNNLEFPAKLLLKINDKKLEFSTINKTKIGIKEKGTHIGLTNVLNRLNHAYGKNYSFSSGEKNGSFQTFLIINT